MWQEKTLKTTEDIQEKKIALGETSLYKARLEKTDHFKAFEKGC